MPVKSRKICVLGHRTVGKTSLIQQFVNNTFSSIYDPTIENIYGQEFEINVVDTAGQEDTSLYPQSYFLGTHGYIIVYAINNAYSFEVASHIHDKILQMTGKMQNPYCDSISSTESKYSSLPHSFGSQPTFNNAQLSNSFYQHHRFSVFSQTPMVLVANKVDLNSNREVTIQMGQKLANFWAVPFFEVSSKSKKSIADVFESVIYEIEKADGNMMPINVSNQQKPKPNCIIS